MDVINLVSRLATSIFAWVLGFLSPAIMKAETSKAGISEAAREAITFYMQNISFLIAIIAGVITIYYLVEKSKKDND